MSTGRRGSEAVAAVPVLGPAVDDDDDDDEDIRRRRGVRNDITAAA